MIKGKELVGSYWAHRTTGERWLVKEQFRVGEDIESWVDLRNQDNLCQMLQTDRLVQDYSRIYLELQNPN